MCRTFPQKLAQTRMRAAENDGKKKPRKRTEKQARKGEWRETSTATREDCQCLSTCIISRNVDSFNITLAIFSTRAAAGDRILGGAVAADFFGVVAPFFTPQKSQKSPWARSVDRRGGDESASERERLADFFFAR